MLRSLNSGVTGLMNHQTRMDVIGNNISNVNTVGYKGRRVTFEESFNQMIKGASRTQSKAGGTNPMQVGLGVSVGSIDIVTGQGNLSNTGRIFDLAIEGNAFFGVSDGSGTFYTKNGAFQLDAEGYIILPSNGMVLQGRMADTYGNFPPGTAIGNLQIPMNQQAPAKETTEVSLGRNLNSEADAKGSVTYSQRMLHPAGVARAPAVNGANDPGSGATTLTSLYDSTGKSLNIKEGDILTISWFKDATIADSSKPDGKLAIRVGTDDAAGEIDNIEELAEAMERALNFGADGTPLNTNHTVTINSDGSLSINYNAGTAGAGDPGTQIFNLQVKSSNPLSDSYVNKAFSFSSHIGPAIGNYENDNLNATSDILLRPAEQFDVMANLRDSNGNQLYLGLDVGDPINVFGAVGKTSIEAGKSDAINFYPPTIYDAGTGSWIHSAEVSSFIAAHQKWQKDYENYVTDLTTYTATDATWTAARDAWAVGIGGTGGDPGFEDADYIAATGVQPRPTPPVGPPAEPAPLPAGLTMTPALGGGVYTDTFTFAFDSTAAGAVAVQQATLLDDLISKIRNDFKLPAEYIDRDGKHTPSVSMNPMGTEDGIPPGSIVIRGAKGVDFSINNLSIVADNGNSDQVSPTYFNATMGFTEKRKAEDVGVVDTVISVYDESGAEHILTIQFVHTGNAGEWEWKASFAGKEDIVPGSGTGKVTFGQDGTVSSWIFDNGGSQLIVDPHNGSNVMRIDLNVGGPGDFRGLTQFASPSTVTCTAQDGYPTGNLIEVTIDEFGLIEGAFSNGTARSIAQIMLVDFANPGGLLDLSDSVYTTSANSGDPIWGLPLTQSSSKLKPGALEMSNVDLAGEFTNMITTQRGYQANSRIITVSDSMLEELVNLKR